MNLTSLLRQRAARYLVVTAAALLIVFQLSSLSAFLSSSASSPLSADYSRVVNQLRADSATFSPLHSITWLLAIMHEVDSEAEIENVRASLRLLRDAGVSADRVVVMERRPVSGSSEQSDSLSSKLGVRVLSLRRGSVVSSVQQYGEMLSAVLSSSSADSTAASSTLCAVIPSHLRLAKDLPGFFLHTARLLKVDSTLLAASASSPFPSLSLSSSWLPTDVHSSSAAASVLRAGNVESQLSSSLPDADTALLLTAASFATVSASLRSVSASTAASLPAALSALSAGRSFISPVVSRAVSLLPSDSVRESERVSAIDAAQSAMAWPDLARLSAIGYGHWLMSLIASCTLLSAVDDVMDRRGECMVLVVPAASSSDVEWHLVLSAWLGAYPIPPVERRQEARGEWRGVVVLRYLSNLVLLVAPYSPLFSSVPPLSTSRGLLLEPRALGCYRHTETSLELPYAVTFLSARSLTPSRCLNACVHRGFQFAGLHDGSACRCGTAAVRRSLSINADLCSLRCSPSSSLPGEAESAACGDLSAVSLYTDSSEAHTRYQSQPAAAAFVKGREGETCAAACQRSMAGACREELFDLLSCGSMRAVGYKAGECLEAAQLTDGDRTRSLHVVSAPYVRTGSGGDGVVLGASRFYDCHATPLPETARACVCAAG